MSIVSTESYVHTILLRPLTRFKMGWPDAYAVSSIAIAFKSEHHSNGLRWSVLLIPRRRMGDREPVERIFFDDPLLRAEGGPNLGESE